jgi:hypothetical protein
MNKLKVNKEAKPNSSDYYINYPVALEDYIGERVITRVSLGTSYSIVKDKFQKLMIIEFEGVDRVGEYPLDGDTSLDYDSKEGTVRFTSRGVQYKIRALQDSDEKLIEQGQIVKSAKKEEEKARTTWKRI